LGWINLLSLLRKYVHFKRIIKEFLLNKNTNNLKQKLNLKKKLYPKLYKKYYKKKNKRENSIRSDEISSKLEK